MKKTTDPNALRANTALLLPPLRAPIWGLALASSLPLLACFLPPTACFSFVLCITTIPLCYIILINHDSLLALTSASASYYTLNNTINMMYLIIILFLGILTTSWNLTLFHLYDRIFINKYEEMMIDIRWYDNNNWYYTYKNTIYPYNVNDIIILCYS
jgi:hypothetical protein